ncbi:MAG: hypothetical protein EBV15_03220 [Bacteroidetes bacterium]|nr:hypothetical protein [Bacteroidota bacterium]
MSGFEAFKQKKQEDRNLAIKEEKNGETSVVQSEIAYDEPPQEEQKVAEPAQVSQETLNYCWHEFSQSAGVRTSSLMKAITPVLQGSEIVVTIASAAQQDAIEDVRMDFIRFISQKTHGAIQSLRIEKGAAEITDRKPYTEKEKLDFMLSKNPEWKEMIDKLGLRLP